MHGASEGAEGAEGAAVERGAEQVLERGIAKHAAHGSHRVSLTRRLRKT
jgi:hypothetical protein